MDTACVEEVDPAEMERRAGEEEWIERMKYVQCAQLFPSDRPTDR